MSSRWTGFFVWALVAACTAFWAMKIFAATLPVPHGATSTVTVASADGPMPRLFGAVVVPEQPVDTPPPESDRFKLVGVIAPTPGGTNGVAIVTIDDQPAKPWHIGSTLEGNTTLLAVAKRSAEFGPSGGPSQFTLELPEPAAPETGTLPAAVSQPNGPAPTPRPMAQQPGQVIPGAVRGGVPPNFPGRVGLPMRPGMAQPGMIQPNVVPPGRTPPTSGAQQVNQANQDGQVQKDDE